MTTIPGDQPPRAAGKPLALSNLSVRVITALALLPVVLYAAYRGGWLLTLLVGVVAAIGVLEFYVLAQGRQAQGSSLIGVPMVVGVVLAFHYHENALWLAAVLLGAALTFALETVRHPKDVRRSLWQVGATLAGAAYVGFPAAFVVAIRAVEPDADGLTWLLAVFLSTWGADTFAYLGGRYFGRRKLAPTLSPKKTVEGAIAGVIGGIVPAFALLMIAGKLSPGALIVVCLAPLVAIAGDLFESALKRFFQVKDSHITGLNIFPGHGGVLDRVDSLLWVAVFYYGYLALNGIVW